MSSFEPSDWKNTRFPKLSSLDSLQRCLICKDYLRAPVNTSCNHTFCSQCIRQHLLSVNYCPLCKSELFESNLKRNILLEEIVLCYQSLRDELIGALNKESEKEMTSHDVKSGDHEESDKRKLDPNVEVIEINDTESDVEKPVVRSSSGSGTPQPESCVPGLVSCPVCNVRMKETHLQAVHLDCCLNGRPDPKITKSPSNKRKANDVSSFFRQKQAKPSRNVDHEHFYFSESHKHQSDKKRLPKVDFASLSTSKVKEKLSSLKLATSGTRPQLELRYNHYYLLHNSNLDSNHPISDVQLRQKLNQWEKFHHAFSSAPAANTIFGDQLSLKSLTDKDFPVHAWLNEYRNQFRDLVKAAKRSRTPKPPTDSDASSKPNDPALEHEGCKPSHPQLQDKSSGTTVPALKANGQVPKTASQESVPEELKNPTNPESLASRASENPDEVFDFRNSTLFS